MTDFYTPQALAQLQKRSRLAGGVCLGIGLAGLAACIAMCCLTRTANAREMMLTTILVSALCGWTVTLLRRWWYLPLRARALHMDSILRDDQDPEQVQELTGEMSVSPVAVAIPHSITVRGVKVRQDGEEISCRVEASLAPLLPTGPARVRLVRGYVTGAEVLS